MTSPDLALADRIIGFLNELIVIDHAAVSALIGTHVPCNEALADHPTVQVRNFTGDAGPTVGIIGVLNGLCGIFDAPERLRGWGPIAARIVTSEPDESGLSIGQVICFERTDQPLSPAAVIAHPAFPHRTLPSSERAATPCEACGQPTETRLCTMCWAALPRSVQDVVYDADDGPDGPVYLAAVDAAVTEARRMAQHS